MLKSSLLFSLLLFSCSTYAQDHEMLYFSHRLNSTDYKDSSILIENHGGKFTNVGWQSVSNKGKLIVKIPNFITLSGRLEISISGLDWEKCNTSSGNNKKLHFINLFSNPAADHHAEDGGSVGDAIISIRGGSNNEGKPRYGNHFKLLWSSSGAKRAPGNRYHEFVDKTEKKWKWNSDSVYHFKIIWSHPLEKLWITVNDNPVYEVDWIDSEKPFKYIYLGASNDFASLQNCTFSNISLFEIYDTKRKSDSGSIEIGGLKSSKNE